MDDLPHDDSCHGKGVGDDSLRHGQFRQGIIIESYGWLYGWLSERPIEGARLRRSGHPPMIALHWAVALMVGLGPVDKSQTKSSNNTEYIQ